MRTNWVAKRQHDGIRTQIASELGLPKAAVKKAVFALRQRQNIPSWWDLQPYHGSPEDLERIRAAYVPLLPKPSVGVHKQLAAQLNLPGEDERDQLGARRAVNKRRCGGSRCHV